MLAAIHGDAGSSLNWNSAGHKLHVARGEINMQKWSSQRRFNQVFGYFETCGKKKTYPRRWGTECG
jgi:hypothetical protein